MHTQHQRGRGLIKRRSGRSLAAILFAVVLTFGPGAWAAQAAVPDQAAAVTAADVEATEVAPDPVPEAAADPVPEPIAAPVPEAVPDPGPVAAEPEPAAVPEAAVEAPEPQAVAPENVGQDAPVVAAEYPPQVTPAVAVTPPACVGVDAPLPTSILAHGTVPAGTFWLGISNGTWSGPEVAVTQTGDYELTLNGEGVYTLTLFNKGHYQVASASFELKRCAEPVPTIPPAVVVAPPACVGVDEPLPTTIPAQVTVPTGTGNFVLQIEREGWSAPEVLVTARGTFDLPVNGEGKYTVSLLNQGSYVVSSTTFVLVRCEEPEPGGPLSMTIFLDQCTVPGGELPSAGRAHVLGAVIGETYHLVVTKDGVEVWSDDVDATAVEFDVVVPLGGPGGYEVTVSHGEESDSASATLAPCPLPPTELSLAILLDQCAAPGGVLSTSATVTISGAAVGETYRVSVEKLGSTDTTADITGAATAALVIGGAVWSEDVVAPATKFDVTVPISGPGTYTVQAATGDTVATATAYLRGCPPEPPVTPPVNPPTYVTVSYTPRAPSKLATTGSSDNGIAVAGIATLAGLAALAAAGRRRLVGDRATRR